LTQSFEVSNGGCASMIFENVPIPDWIIDDISEPGQNSKLWMELYNNPMYEQEEVLILTGLTEKADGMLLIWDLSGRMVKVISQQTFIPGEYTFRWNGYTKENKITALRVINLDIYFFDTLEK